MFSEIQRNSRGVSSFADIFKTKIKNILRLELAATRNTPTPRYLNKLPKRARSWCVLSAQQKSPLCTIYRVLISISYNYLLVTGRNMRMGALQIP